MHTISLFEKSSLKVKTMVTELQNQRVSRLCSALCFVTAHPWKAQVCFFGISRILSYLARKCRFHKTESIYTILVRGHEKATKVCPYEGVVLQLSFQIYSISPNWSPLDEIGRLLKRSIVASAQTGFAQQLILDKYPGFAFRFTCITHFYFSYLYAGPDLPIG